MSDQSNPTGEWQCDKCGYMNTGVICTHCATPKPTGERFVMKDHLIFDTQADAFIGAGDACYMLDEARHAIEELQQQLADEREQHRKEMEAVTMNTSDIETVQQLREQLATREHRTEVEK